MLCFLQGKQFISDFAQHKSGNTEKVLLSYNPRVKIGQVVDAITFKNSSRIRVLITDIKEVNTKDLGESELDKYLKSGGRKDVAWVVEMQEK